MKFELCPKDARVKNNLPTPLLDRIKQRAAERAVPYQKLMRDLMGRGLEKMG
jgi:predicted DNA binding CopG/RHH family protein